MSPGDRNVYQGLKATSGIRRMKCEHNAIRIGGKIAEKYRKIGGKIAENIKIIERGQVPKDSKTQEIKGAAGIKVLTRGFEEDVRVVQRSR